MFRRWKFININLFHADANYRYPDADAPGSDLLFGYRRMYQCIVRTEPSLIDVPVIVIMGRFGIPEPDDRDREAKLEWLAEYDRQVCADPDVLGVALDVGLGTEPESAALRSFTDWYAGYVKGRSDTTAATPQWRR